MSDDYDATDRPHHRRCPQREDAACACAELAEGDWQDAQEARYEAWEDRA